ncbi:MAG TPA: hypothetical protein PLL64_00400, partial [Rhodothermales bacterium]|nr:hypothetical protein [Rhodothermales bacterium]
MMITKSHLPGAFFLQGYEMAMQEEKRIYEKELCHIPSIASEVQFFSLSGLEARDLYPLAFEAGKFSRFRLDPHFGEDAFRRLYRRWVEASINGTFADAVFVLVQKEALRGFVTVKIKEKIGYISLIASDPCHQHQGVGSTLVVYA